MKMEADLLLATKNFLGDSVIFRISSEINRKFVLSNTGKYLCTWARGYSGIKSFCMWNLDTMEICLMPTLTNFDLKTVIFSKYDETILLIEDAESFHHVPECLRSDGRALWIDCITGKLLHYNGGNHDVGMKYFLYKDMLLHYEDYTETEEFAIVTRDGKIHEYDELIGENLLDVDFSTDGELVIVNDKLYRFNPEKLELLCSIERDSEFRYIPMHNEEKITMHDYRLVKSSTGVIHDFGKYLDADKHPIQLIGHLLVASDRNMITYIDLLTEKVRSVTDKGNHARLHTTLYMTKIQARQFLDKMFARVPQVPIYELLTEDLKYDVRNLIYGF